MSSLPSPSPPLHSTASKQIWLNPRHKQRQYLDHSIHLPSLLSSLRSAASFPQLAGVMSRYVAASQPLLSLRLMCSLLSSPSLSPSRSLALLDWMYSKTDDTSSSCFSLYPLELHPYNLVLRSFCRAQDFGMACGLLIEMRSIGLTPDAVSYSTVLSALSSAGCLDLAMHFLPLMEEDKVTPDLILYSTLMHLSLKLNDPSKAISLFERMKASGVVPDLRAFNAAINAHCSAGLLRDASRILTRDMPLADVAPDAVSYSTLLSGFVKRGRFLSALSLFAGSIFKCLVFLD